MTDRVRFAHLLGARRVPERSNFDLTLVFVDGETVGAPSSDVQYRVKNPDTNTEILAWTTISAPTSQETIQVTSTANTLETSGNQEEARTLVVRDANGNTLGSFNWIIDRAPGLQ